MMKKIKGIDNEKKADWLRYIICLFPVLFFLILNAYCFDTYYDLNDDITIRDLLSGAFTGSPNAHTVFMRYAISFFIALLYRLFPSVSWFGVCEIALLALSCFVINISISRLTKKRHLQILMSITGTFIFQAVLMYQIIFVQYSVVSGVLATAGIVCFFFSDGADGKIRTSSIVTSIVLFALSFCVRTNIFLLISPFVFVSIVIKLLIQDKKTKKELIKKVLLSIASFTGIVLVIAIVDIIAYSSEGWHEYAKFNDYETTLYDFQKDAPWYMFHPEIYDEIGFTESEAQIIVDNNLQFTDKIDTAILGKVVDYNENVLGKGYFAIGIKEAITFYFYTLHKTKECKYCYLILALYTFLIIVAIAKRKYIYLPAALSVFAARSVGWMYLILRGRVKDRVTVPLCFCEVMILTCLLIKLTYDEKKVFVFIAITCILLTIMYPMFRRTLKDTNTEYALRVEKDKGWKAYKEYCDSHSDSFYLMDLISNIDFSEKMFAEPDNRLTNYALCGGWLSKAPAFDEKLMQYGIDAVDEAILNRNDVYFVSIDFREMNWLSGYYKDRGYDVSCDEIDRIYISDSEYYVVFKVVELK